MKVEQLREEMDQEAEAIKRMLKTADGKIFCKMLHRDVLGADYNPQESDMAMRIIGEIRLANRILRFADE